MLFRFNFWNRFVDYLSLWWTLLTKLINKLLHHYLFRPHICAYDPLTHFLKVFKQKISCVTWVEFDTLNTNEYVSQIVRILFTIVKWLTMRMGLIFEKSWILTKTKWLSKYKMLHKSRSHPRIFIISQSHIVISWMFTSCILKCISFEPCDFLVVILERQNNFSIAAIYYWTKVWSDFCKLSLSLQNDYSRAQN